MSPAVQRVMCIAGMMNAPWINYGRSYNYKTKTRADSIANNIRTARAKLPSLMPEVYKLAREQEEENIIFRRIKEDKAALDLLLTRIDEEDLKPEEIFSEDETEFIRSKMFYRLKDMLDEIDNKVNVLNPATRKLIIHKMNRLSRVGILPKEETEKQFRAFKEEVTTIDSAKKALVLEKFSRSSEIMKEVEETFQTITKEEFIRLFQRYRPGYQAENIDEVRSSSENRSPLTSTRR